MLQNFTYRHVKQTNATLSPQVNWITKITTCWCNFLFHQCAFSNFLLDYPCTRPVLLIGKEYLDTLICCMTSWSPTSTTQITVMMSRTTWENRKSQTTCQYQFHLLQASVSSSVASLTQLLHCYYPKLAFWLNTFISFLPLWEQQWLFTITHSSHDLL